MLARQLTDVAGRPVALPDPERLVHLQFRRFAGCPICSLHLRSVARRHDEIEAAGIKEIVVFHSPASELREYVDELPFTVIADPERRLYVEFGVEPGLRALLDPRVWPVLARGFVRSAWLVVRHRARPPALWPTGGRFGLPGDFLIDSGGRIIASKHGRHASDQWSVDELLALSVSFAG